MRFLEAALGHPWEACGGEAQISKVPNDQFRLNNPFNCLISGTKEANTNSASVSDANSSSLPRESAEPEPAVKQKGEKGAPCQPLLSREGDPAPPMWRACVDASQPKATAAATGSLSL